MRVTVEIFSAASFDFTAVVIPVSSMFSPSVSPVIDWQAASSTATTSAAAIAPPLRHLVVIPFLPFDGFADGAGEQDLCLRSGRECRRRIGRRNGCCDRGEGTRGVLTE